MKRTFCEGYRSRQLLTLLVLSAAPASLGDVIRRVRARGWRTTPTFVLRALSRLASDGYAVAIQASAHERAWAVTRDGEDAQDEAWALMAAGVPA